MYIYIIFAYIFYIFQYYKYYYMNLTNIFNIGQYLYTHIYARQSRGTTRQGATQGPHQSLYPGRLQGSTQRGFVKVK